MAGRTLDKRTLARFGSIPANGRLDYGRLLTVPRVCQLRNGRRLKAAWPQPH